MLTAKRSADCPHHLEYLRWPRLISFAFTSSLSVAVFGLAAWSLKVLIDKKNIARQLPGGVLHANDVIGAGGALTAAAGFTSLACIGFIIMTFFRLHKAETYRTVLLKEGIFAFAWVFLLAALIAQTVVYASKSATVTSSMIPQTLVDQIISVSGQSLAYKDIPAVRADTIVGWVAWASLTITLILVSLAARHSHREHSNLSHNGQSHNHTGLNEKVDATHHP